MQKTAWDLAPFNIIYVENSEEFGVAPEELWKNSGLECLEAVKIIILNLKIIIFFLYLTICINIYTYAKYFNQNLFEK